MNLRTALLIIALSAPFLAIAQIDYQIGIGPSETPNETTINLEFDNSTNVLFQKVINYGPRVAFLGSYLVNDKLSIRTGLAGHPTHFYGEIFIFQDDPAKKQSLFKDYDYVNLIIPLEVQYKPTSWLYLTGGLGLNMLFDVTWDERFERNSLLLGLTEDERDDFYEVIDNQVRIFTLLYRASAMLRYKRIGLELGYEHLFTNVLRPFEYDGIQRKETIRYGDIYLKLVYLFEWPWLTDKLGATKSQKDSH